MKRKADTEPNAGISQAANGSTGEKPAKRQNKSRASSIASATSPIITTATAAESGPPQDPSTSMTAPPTLETASQPNNEAQKRKEPSKGTGPQGRVIDVSTPRRVAESRGGPDILPSGKVFPIQIGSELFRLSGASISSDGEYYAGLVTESQSKLTMQERPRTSPIFSESKFTAIKVVLET